MLGPKADIENVTGVFGISEGSGISVNTADFVQHCLEPAHFLECIDCCFGLIVT